MTDFLKQTAETLSLAADFIVEHVRANEAESLEMAAAATSTWDRVVQAAGSPESAASALGAVAAGVASTLAETMQVDILEVFAQMQISVSIEDALRGDNDD
jgi:ABC-type protease/lipase transport system fused ATPase/permease subunit